MFQHSPDRAGTAGKELAHSKGQGIGRRNHCSFSIGHTASKVAFEAHEFHKSRVLNHHVWNGRRSKFIYFTVLLSAPAGDRYGGGHLFNQATSVLLSGRKQFLDTIQSIPDGAQLYFHSVAVFSVFQIPLAFWQYLYLDWVGLGTSG
jgi:hypothetical protein